ncbi:poly-beta-1,6 N-acetyl-D-glucosamine export porin PgaA [Neisseria dumasiana]|uniref:poly-beta-1,6 N-acetyl-D-glucosamine export porin PgaA n=1 Tax=Neisseria dumasiana TaxID=1931275 RepID=UPI000A220C54|nr:poly-beta-1,6 N-acetyl-D-glucosamine export porin PgaA [Neisseria dumasiana]OSI17164.1 poly-beta-1,6 N-acetyl-D-glucosamine export porin PgaA [Neisseria dumasiana]
MMKTIHKLPLGVVALFAAAPFAFSQDIQAERERWAVHARSGAAQLAESVAQLQKLYGQSGDAKVRADLIALLLRQGKAEDILSICPDCRIEDYAADELENIAKAARDSRRYRLSADFYRRLQVTAPNHKVGYLGAALASTDAGDYAAAKHHIDAYRKRFGSDKDIQEAEHHLKRQTLTETELLGEQQRRWEADPTNQDKALQLYRTAARLQLFPLQESIISRFPQAFTEQDQLWLEAAKAATLLRTARFTSDSPQLRSVYNRLSALVGKVPEGSELHTQVLRDRMAAAVAVGNEKQALRDYRVLARQGSQPDYVQEQYGRALLMAGSPRKAGKVLERNLANQNAARGKPDPELVELLIRKDADLMRFDQGQAKLKYWNAKKYTPDFTHSVEIKNPYYANYHYWNARLQAWKGDVKGAKVMMQSWLDEHPADPWGLVLKGELLQLEGHTEQAVRHFEQAREYLSEADQKWVDAKSAAAYIEAGNWPAVRDLSAGLGKDDVNYEEFRRNHKAEKAAQLNISGTAMKATSPEDGTEWRETVRLDSPRSSEGHRAYIVQQHAHVPNNGNALDAGRVGVGAEVNLYPVIVRAEAGRGTQLNDKSYGSLSADYRINDYVGVNAKAAFNSDNTPVKAWGQGVYADEYTVNAQYNHSGKTHAGIGAGVMKFDDGNTRRAANAWLAHDIFQYNRWKLASSVAADYSRNKNIPGAFYFNPESSKTLGGELAVSYTLPLDHDVRLVQTATGGVGRYWQSGAAAKNTWLLKYGHGWSFGRRAMLGYEFGRRQAMYDGVPEYQNFGNLNLKVKLY